MKFKIDENLPIEFAELLRSQGYNAETVKEENLCGKPDENIIEVCQQENRILVTLDLDFADIRAYPPQNYSGIIVLRASRQDKLYLLSIFAKIIPSLRQETINNTLWIVEENKIRIRT
ncbi:DUF5615 family PIN-like protein [Geminocystis herdmanii]|uniref:DUF5615 family PIN-like protein n=1 Tax=Geminocystis herdmanii TaxID=669359 RepID=UPI0003485BC2|nr:DUF5615 family PIN-like protein [Geminocystis herdmanii]